MANTNPTIENSRVESGPDPEPEPVPAARMRIRYPLVEVQLVDRDGNASMILARVRQALKRAGAPKSDIDEFTNEATAGDYDHLIQTCIQWVDIR